MKKEVAPKRYIFHLSTEKISWGIWEISSCLCLCFRCLGASLALCPEYSLVLEDELGVCGCAVGILDVRSFAKRCQATWLPAMRDKYPSRLHGASGHATKVKVTAKHKTRHNYTAVLLKWCSSNCLILTWFKLHFLLLTLRRRCCFSMKNRTTQTPCYIISHLSSGLRLFLNWWTVASVVASSQPC